MSPLALVGASCIVLLVQDVAGLALLGSAASKLNDPQRFAGIVRAYRLLPGPLAGLVAVALPLAELVIGAALLLRMETKPVALAAAALLMIFAVAIGINVLRGRTGISCGCFLSERASRLSWPLVGRNLAAAAALSASTTIGAVAIAPLLRVEIVFCAVILLTLAFAVSVLRQRNFS